MHFNWLNCGNCVPLDKFIQQFEMVEMHEHLALHFFFAIFFALFFAFYSICGSVLNTFSFFASSFAVEYVISFDADGDLCGKHTPNFTCTSISHV